MTKSALAATSLVAALPGGLMAYLAVMAFMNHMTSMPMLMQVVLGTVLLCSALMALSPFGILLFAKGAPKADKTAKDESATAGIATVPARDSGSDSELPTADEEMGFGADDDFGEVGDDDFSASTDDDFGELDAMDDASAIDDADAMGDAEVEAEETLVGSQDDDEFSFEDDNFEFEDDDENK